MTDLCIRDLWASLSNSAILSSKDFAVPLPSPASFHLKRKAKKILNLEILYVINHIKAFLMNLKKIDKEIQKGATFQLLVVSLPKSM